MSHANTPLCVPLDGHGHESHAILDPLRKETGLDSCVSLPVRRQERSPMRKPTLHMPK
jgi:hypothetical protein